MLARVETSGPQADTKKQAAAGLSGYRDMTEHRHFELCIGQTLEAPSQRVHTTRGITRLPSPLLQQVQTVANHPAHGDLWLHLASLCSTLSQTTYDGKCSSSDNSKELIPSLRDETPHFRGSDLWAFIFEGHLSPPTHTCTVKAG